MSGYTRIYNLDPDAQLKINPRALRAVALAAFPPARMYGQGISPAAIKGVMMLAAVFEDVPLAARGAGVYLGCHHNLAQRALRWCFIKGYLIGRPTGINNVYAFTVNIEAVERLRNIDGLLIRKKGRKRTPEERRQMSAARRATVAAQRAAAEAAA